jgi:hypothetical protein
LATTEQRKYNSNKKEIITIQIAFIKKEALSKSSDQTIYFDISKLDKEFKILLNRYYNSSNKQQKYINRKVAAFFKKYNLYLDIKEYCIQYRKPTSILDYILLYSRLKAILASRLLFIQLDL